jgi:hypothetical protein
MTIKTTILFLVLLRFNFLSYSQQTIHAEDIISDIKAGKNISIENATIEGVLDFTFMEEKLQKLPKKKPSRHQDNKIDHQIAVKISFINCTFEDDVLAYIPDHDKSGYTFVANFEEMITFKNCVFESRALFKHSVFDDISSFRRSNFSGDSTFKHAIFKEISDFSNTYFENEAVFKHTMFKKSVTFENTIFEEDATFKHTVFYEGVSFKDTRFKGSLNAKHTAVKGNFDMTGMKVNGEIDSKHMTINGQSFSSYLLNNQ